MKFIHFRLIFPSNSFLWSLEVWLKEVRSEYFRPKFAHPSVYIFTLYLNTSNLSPFVLKQLFHFCFYAFLIIWVHVYIFIIFTNKSYRNCLATCWYIPNRLFHVVYVGKYFGSPHFIIPPHLLTFWFGLSLTIVIIFLKCFNIFIMSY